MSRIAPLRSDTAQRQREGVTLLAGVIVLMWVVEAINSLDGQGLDSAGIRPRNIDHLWAIFTAPFLHVSFSHLIANSVPFAFMGLIIALRGAVRLALVSLIVIVVGGLGTWLIAPGASVTVGASGVVFGYATYLLVRGFFDRSALELLTGVLVGVIWGAALVSSLIPHDGISWQGHLCGGIGGVVAAYALRRERAGTGTGRGRLARPSAAPIAGTLAE